MAAPFNASNQLEAGVRIGDFEIEKRLGAGGMGIVYQARQVSLGRRVALKVLGSALKNANDLTRFQREAHAAARLKHANIAAIYFIGQDGEVCYHVMEFVDGIPLQRVIERLVDAKVAQSSPDTVVSVDLNPQHEAPAVRFDQPTADDAFAPSAGLPTMDETRSPVATSGTSLSPAAKKTRSGAEYVRRCCEIVRDAARALAYAHGEGVVHRDIKPENLMLDQQGQVRIIDFGLARFFDDVSVTQTGQLVGTPLYMSPEQVTGRVKVDHRTDIYSLGLVLYELLTLRRPFDITSREGLLQNIVTKALPPLRARNSALPKALEAVVHMATLKDPEERYQSAAELADELDRFLNGQPVLAPPYRYRLDLQEIVARRPGAVVLAAFICFLIGCTVFAAVASMGVMMSVMTNAIALLAVVLFAVPVLAGSALLSRGLLAGWNWTRWVVIVLAVMAALSNVVGCVGFAVAVPTILDQPDIVAPVKNGDDANPKVNTISARQMMLAIVLMYAVPVSLAFLCVTTTFVCLILPSTTAWFRMASEARREHQAMLKSLGD